jgi:hypothetical protein
MMSATEIAATVCYVLALLMATAFGVVYLTKSKFMPYHSDALQASWDELDSNLQVLLLALMRSAGGGWLGVSLGVAFLLWFPFRAGERWAMYAIPVIGLAVALPSLYATLLVKNRTPASPPANLVAAAILFLVLGFFLSLI